LDLFLNYKNELEAETQVEVDLALAKSYYEASKALASEFAELKNDFTLNTLLKSPDVVKQTQAEVKLEEISKIIESVISDACLNLNQMREFEGQKLKADLLERINNVEVLVNIIKERAPLIKQEYAKKLKDRVEEILSGVQVDETRLLQEVAIFADKSNIDEELTRLNSHISQFRKICEDGREAGKRLDFLIQEFNREANTVCSKSNDIVVTDTALKLKCEIEKLREQIQNVE
ncbi:MAG: YicC family protein, partial [Clostridia bacterium]|nr:YicC family protein [Clostridia bacterium]